jgi:uncharacterized protein YqgC (DUF456 family)
MFTNDQFSRSIIIYSIILSVSLLSHKSVREKIFQLFSMRSFQINLAIIIPFVIYILNKTQTDKETSNMKKATIQALIGFIISVFGYLDIIGAPFFLIWITSYFLG